MNKRRSNIAWGVILLLVGVWFLAAQLVPALGAWMDINFSWPFIVIGTGVLLFVLGVLLGVPGLAVPAGIVGGIGCLLYYQNTTGDWGSWAYAWALIPGFVGVGILLAGLLGENRRESLRGGFWLIFISLVLFAIFGSFLGGLNILGPYWPALLILLGLWLLVQPVLRKR